MNSCTHHWVIDLPNGSSSFGTCKLCGRVKEFHNVIDDITRFEVVRRSNKEKKDAIVRANG